VTTSELLDYMDREGACHDATDWVEANRHRSVKQLWDTCPRGEWLMWLCDVLRIDDRYRMAAAIGCAQGCGNQLPFRERRALVVGIAWTQGKATDRALAKAHQSCDTGYSGSWATSAAAAAIEPEWRWRSDALDCALMATTCSDATRAEQARRVRAIIPFVMVESALAEAVRTMREGRMAA
jgi:hypothetical protein